MRGKYPAELSGGMIKRVALARALALDPDIVFLDEPTSGLDPIGAAEFDELIRTLQRTLGLSVFMVTHDLDSLHAVCGRIAVLSEGRVIAAGPIETMLASEHPWLKSYFRGKRGRRRPPLRQRRGPFMETKANYIVTGLFTLAVIVGAFGFIYWFQNTGGSGDAHRLPRGVRRFGVGPAHRRLGHCSTASGSARSTELALDPNDPRKVVALLIARSRSAGARRHQGRR